MKQSILCLRLCLQVQKRHQKYMISFWGNPDYEIGLLLTMATGDLTIPAAKWVREYIEAHVLADGSHGITCAHYPQSLSVASYRRSARATLPWCAVVGVVLCRHRSAHARGAVALYAP